MRKNQKLVLRKDKIASLSNQEMATVLGAKGATSPTSLIACGTTIIIINGTLTSSPTSPQASCG